MSIIDPAEYGSGGVGEISSHILSNVGLACRLTISARAMEPVRACGEDRHIGTVHATPAAIYRSVIGTDDNVDVVLAPAIPVLPVVAFSRRGLGKR